MNVRMIQYFVVAIAAPLTLAACGGGSGSSKSTASGDSTTTTVKGADAQRTALRDCLKQHGVTLPDGFGGGDGAPPSGGTPGSFPAGGTPPSLPAGVDTQELQSAFQACGGTGGGPPGGGQNSQAFQAYTSCLSDHGVKVPTRTDSSTPPTFDRNSSTFATANKVCSALLPNTTTTAPK